MRRRLVLNAALPGAEYCNESDFEEDSWKLDWMRKMELRRIDRLTDSSLKRHTDRRMALGWNDSWKGWVAESL